MVYVFLAQGFEEIEALATVDLLRREKIDVTMVSINDNIEVTGSHAITIKADKLIKDINIEDADMLFLPGGLPGTYNLRDCEKLNEMLKLQYEKGKYIAAICAAPTILGGLGFLEGKKAICFKGFEEGLGNAVITNQKVVVDSNIITARGMGASTDIGLKIVEVFKGKDIADALEEKIGY